MCALPPPPVPFTPATPRHAAAVILVRESNGRLEVFWVRRAKGLAFPGFHAFPGGAVNAADGTFESASPFAVAAARELFEETGVLLGAKTGSREGLARIRRDLLEGRIALAAALRAMGTRLDLTALVPAGRWITPPFAPRRFDTRFFLARLPAGQQTDVWEGELERGEWIAPSDALRRWETGDALLHPPALHALRVLATSSPADRVERLNAPPHAPNHVAERIELQRGIRVMPLLAPTLPPARHTACYVIGDGELIIVDPGSPYPAEQERLAAVVQGLVAEGRRILAVVLTHRHIDHVSGAHAAQATFAAPIWAHRTTAESVPGVSRFLEDGDELELDGEHPMRLRALHTPGHANGHLCLWDVASRALVCGDMLSSASTIVIDPPDGDMGLYLSSLDRLRSLCPRTIYPAHGEVMSDGPRAIDEAIAHRRWREERLLGALQAGRLSLEDVTRRAYPDVPAAALPLAERSALASLLWLERQGKALRDGDRFAAVS